MAIDCIRVSKAPHAAFESCRGNAHGEAGQGKMKAARLDRWKEVWSAALAAQQQVELLFRHVELLLHVDKAFSDPNGLTMASVHAQCGGAKVVDALARSAISLLETCRRALPVALASSVEDEQTASSGVTHGDGLGPYIPETMYLDPARCQRLLSMLPDTISPGGLPSADLGPGAPLAPRSSKSGSGSWAGGAAGGHGPQAPGHVAGEAPTPTPVLVLGGSSEQTEGSTQQRGDGASWQQEQREPQPCASPAAPLPPQRPSAAAELPGTMAAPTKRLRRSFEGQTEEDRWGWRKYGQKAIQGTPYYRSYFRCSSRAEADCRARKLVDHDLERSLVVSVHLRGHHSARCGLAEETADGGLKRRKTGRASRSPASSAKGAPAAGEDDDEEMAEEGMGESPRPDPDCGAVRLAAALHGGTGAYEEGAQLEPQALTGAPQAATCLRAESEMEDLRDRSSCSTLSLFPTERSQPLAELAAPSSQEARPWDLRWALAPALTLGSPLRGPAASFENGRDEGGTLFSEP